MNPKNAYYVLELAHDASPGEIERQGRKLLGLLELGAAKAATYTCPLGTFRRDGTMVREAMAALRDPKRRVREALLVRVLAREPADKPFVDVDVDAPLPDAFRIGGYEGL